ncbi:MAG TPA: signal recognition particle-docking protein FtsY [Deltaproteobacteria bacterium]|nr:signal recognition particle-docking protein FtsY [Deltaproteobacteria bacterium]
MAWKLFNAPQKPLDQNQQPEGFFKRLRQGLSKTRKQFSAGLESIFTGKTAIDEDLLEDLEELLITSDVGIQTTMDLIERVSQQAHKITDSDQLKEVLKQETLRFFHEPPPIPDIAAKPHVIMVVGVNGVGKTTTIGKLAAKYAASGKKVLIAAADTFRAAAVEQLGIWAERAGADIVKHKENADPAAVAFDAIDAAVARDIDIVLIDTAGRIHTRVNLMEELKKIKRTVSKRMPDAPHEILLVLDATTGQNALSQANLFHDALEITGIALTKLDGTAKGGIVVSITNALNIPLDYVGVGETIEDLQEFDPKQFVNALF